ncbi:aldo/keto reductase [Dinghuibacter silviterrae]|uniref:aldo/keto reductase n=1 Tax=Dinghuibacter silviterrae TaxID=1539049 RepID=UPI001FE3D629|nr:aldo/keto reductase [Dinghuibacter silviterrae]
MKYRLLGNTGLKVSELCLGTMTFGGKGGIWSSIGEVTQDDVDHLIKRSLDAGINFIDTANVYSYGVSEEMTGTAFRRLGLDRDSLVLATKVRGMPAKAGPRRPPVAVGEGRVKAPTRSASPANTSSTRSKKVSAVSGPII